MALIWLLLNMVEDKQDRLVGALPVLRVAGFDSSSIQMFVWSTDSCLLTQPRNRSTRTLSITRTAVKIHSQNHPWSFSHEGLFCKKTWLENLEITNSFLKTIMARHGLYKCLLIFHKISRLPNKWRVWIRSLLEDNLRKNFG